jgi:CDP-diacylglycerol--glycerol-3-phosphate 3-phosphatidyltransferase
VTANQVTLAAAVLSIVAGIFVSTQSNEPRVLLILPLILFVRMALNAIDGMLAREHGQASKLGAILNELCDVFSDVALYLPLGVFTGFHPKLVSVIVSLSIISEFSGVLGQTIGATRRYDGPMGKSDRAFWLGSLAILVGSGWVPAGAWINWVLSLLIALLMVTIIRRARRALRSIT